MPARVKVDKSIVRPEMQYGAEALARAMGEEARIETNEQQNNER